MEQPPIVATEPVEVIMHNALIEAFVAWLNARGLLLIPYEAKNDDRLASYLITPKNGAG